MADAKITELAALGATPDDADLLAIVDDVVGTATTKKITVSNFLSGALDLGGALSGDETWSGITIPGTAGATIAVGDACYLASTGKWLLNDGIYDGTDTGFDKQLGICVLAGNDTDPTEMLTYGKVRSAAFPSLTIGAPVYLSDTAGDLTVTQPTTSFHVTRIVGFGMTAEDLLFNPSNDWVSHV